MNVMELFSGVGGGILGALLCGHRIVCAVELDAYCRSVLVQRQNDRRLPPFPIWDDIRTFDGRAWRGTVDVVSGGFPCQNISPAGNRTGITGEKSSLWFEMLRVIREVRPQYVFVENSSQLIRRGLDVVLGGLDESGYDAEWCVLGADDVGAPHIRKRCWILGKITDSTSRRESGEGQKAHESGRLRPVVSDPDGQRQLQPKGRIENERQRFGDGGQDVSDTGNNRLEQWFGQLPGVNRHKGLGIDHGGRVQVDAFREWWQFEPCVGRLVARYPHRLDALKGLGNAQVPLCHAVAWQTLYQKINEE